MVDRETEIENAMKARESQCSEKRGSGKVQY